MSPLRHFVVDEGLRPGPASETDCPHRSPRSLFRPGSIVLLSTPPVLLLSLTVSVTVLFLGLIAVSQNQQSCSDFTYIKDQRRNDVWFG